MRTELKGEWRVEALLRDPLARLIMASDRVSDTELRSMLRQVQAAIRRRPASGAVAG